MQVVWKLKNKSRWLYIYYNHPNSIDLTVIIQFMLNLLFHKILAICSAGTPRAPDELILHTQNN